MEQQTVQTEAVTTAQETKKLSQKEATLLYVKEALQEAGITPAEGDSLAAYVSKDLRKVVRKKLFDGFRSGVIRLSKDKDDSKLKKYCSGLINNWLNKDERFKK